MKRLGGICRDHAMLGVAVLRHHGIPARLRGGFSRYFTAGFWDDHWVAATSVVRDAASLACIELLPWDCWSGIDTLTKARERLPEFAAGIDAIADRLLGGGATFENAWDVLETVPWIGIPETIVSYNGSGDPGFETVTLSAA